MLRAKAKSRFAAGRQGKCAACWERASRGRAAEGRPNAAVHALACPSLRCQFSSVVRSFVTVSGGELQLAHREEQRAAAAAVGAKAAGLAVEQQQQAAAHAALVEQLWVSAAARQAAEESKWEKNADLRWL